MTLIEALQTVLGLAEVGDEHDDHEVEAISIANDHLANLTDESSDWHGLVMRDDRINGRS